MGSNVRIYYLRGWSANERSGKRPGPEELSLLHSSLEGRSSYFEFGSGASTAPRTKLAHQRLAVQICNGEFHLHFSICSRLSCWYERKSTSLLYFCRGLEQLEGYRLAYLTVLGSSHTKGCEAFQIWNGCPLVTFLSNMAFVSRIITGSLQKWSDSPLKVDIPQSKSTSGFIIPGLTLNIPPVTNSL